MKRIGFWLLAITLVCIIGSAVVAQQDDERITIRCRDAKLQKVIVAIAEFGLPTPTFDTKVRDRDVTLMLADVTPEFALDFVLEKYGLEKREAGDGGLLITVGTTRADAEPAERPNRPLLAGADDSGDIIIHRAQMAPPLGGGGGGGMAAPGGGLGGLGMGMGGQPGAAAGSEEEVEYIFEIIEAKHIGLLMLATGGAIMLNGDVMMGGGYGGGGYGGGGYGGGGYGGGGYGGGGYGGGGLGGGGGNWGGGGFGGGGRGGFGGGGGNWGGGGGNWGGGGGNWGGGGNRW